MFAIIVSLSQSFPQSRPGLSQQNILRFQIPVCLAPVIGSLFWGQHKAKKLAVISTDPKGPRRSFITASKDYFNSMDVRFVLFPPPTRAASSSLLTPFLRSFHPGYRSRSHCCFPVSHSPPSRTRFESIQRMADSLDVSRL